MSHFTPSTIKGTTTFMWQRRLCNEDIIDLWNIPSGNEDEEDF